MGTFDFVIDSLPDHPAVLVALGAAHGFKHKVLGARRHEAINAPIFNCGADGGEGGENQGRNERE